MAHFIGIMRGNRGDASRTGSKDSGIEAHVRGLNVGIYVACIVDKDGRDVCVAHATGGSNSPSRIGKRTFRVKSKK